MKSIVKKTLIVSAFCGYWLFTCWFIALPLTMEVAYELGQPGAYIPIILPVCFCLLLAEWYVVALFLNRKHVVVALTIGTMLLGGLLWGHILTRPTKENRNKETQGLKDHSRHLSLLSKHDGLEQ